MVSEDAIQTSEIWRAHIVECEQLLSQLQSRRVRLDNQRSELAPTNLHTSIRSVDLVIEHLSAQEALLEAQLAAARQTLSSRLRDLPEELLAEIFTYGSAGADDYSDAQLISVNAGRARAPFVVSAVCRQWRDVALAASKLWHYLPILDLTDTAHPSRTTTTLSYIAIVLERSRSVPIDIVFEYIADEGRAAYEDVLAALDPARHRWRRFVAPLQGSETPEMLFKALRGPTPALRTFEMSLQNAKDDWTMMFRPHTQATAHAHILPEVPSIKHVTLGNVEWPWSSESSPRLLGLEWTRWTTRSDIWDVLRPQTRLTWLLLSTNHLDSEFEAPVERIALPELGTLWVLYQMDELFERFGMRIDMPKVKKIIIVKAHVERMATTFTRVWEHLTIIDMRRVQPIGQSGVDALVALRNVQHAAFVACAVPGMLLLRLSATGAGSETSVPLVVNEDAAASQAGVVGENAAVSTTASVDSTAAPATMEVQQPVLSESTAQEASQSSQMEVVWPKLTQMSLDGAQFDDDDEERLVELARMRCSRPGPLNSSGTTKWALLTITFVGDILVTGPPLEEIRQIQSDRTPQVVIA